MPRTAVVLASLCAEPGYMTSRTRQTFDGMAGGTVVAVYDVTETRHGHDPLPDTYR
jgi:hypothetical protein